MAEGTGQSSGKVVELDLYNPTGRTVTREIGPFVTTAREGRQAYVINNTYRVEVPPQSTVSLDIADNIADISAIAMQNSATAGEHNEQARRLKELAAHLKAAMSRFRLGELRAIA